MAVAVQVPAHAAPVPSSWTFEVLLDGKPIGTHRFVLSDEKEGATRVHSLAQFDARFLGVPLYRYRHLVEELWSDGCLRRIDAKTDDNGRVADVHGESKGDRFEVQVRADGHEPQASAVPGCLLSFAYWNPALADQTRLLDPGTGRVENVRVTATTPPPDLGLPAQAPVRGLRIDGLARPIDVWYSGKRWVGLDTVVSGGRRLSYRLR